MKRILRKLNVLILASVMINGCLFGCSEVKEEETPLIAVDKQVEDIRYHMDEVTSGTVKKTVNVNAQYVQTKEQQVAFKEGGKIVDKVYVREGEKVNKGDILVELRSDNLEEQILDLEYNIKQSQLQLGFLDKNEEFDKEDAHITLIKSGLTGDDYCNYEEAIKQIERRYRYQREDLNDTILFDQKKLAELNEELSSKRIYAEMSGTVIAIKKKLEGSTAKRDDVIMTVVDNSNGLFETENPELSEYVKDGDLFTMSIVYGNAKGEYVLSPFEKQNWGEKQLFSIIEAPEAGGLEVGTSGTISVVIDEKDNVLRIPVNALYEAEDKYYTYILDEDNIRKAQFIEIGLIGDDYVEVLSGLKLKDQVIKK